MGDISGFIIRPKENYNIEKLLKELEENLKIRFLYRDKGSNLIFGVAKSSYPEGVYVDLYNIEGIDNFSTLYELNNKNDYILYNNEK